MLSGPVYITPTELLTRAPLGSIPRADVPGPFRGRIGAVTHMGTSTGTVTLSGFVIDAYQLVLRVVTVGDLGVMQLAISLDGGATYDDPLLSTPNQEINTIWRDEIGITGIMLTATSGTYHLGDTWTATTTASPKLVQVCGALSDLYRKWAHNTGQPVTDIDEADRTMLCQLGRVWVTSDRGDIPEPWLKLATTAERYFRLESLGDIRQNSTPDPDSFVYPNIEQARPAYKFTSPGTRIPVWRH